MHDSVKHTKQWHVKQPNNLKQTSWNQALISKALSFMSQNRVGFSTALFGSLHLFCDCFQWTQEKTTKSCIWWHLDNRQYLVNLYWLIISEIVGRCKKVCLVSVTCTLQGHPRQSYMNLANIWINQLNHIHWWLN